MKKMVSILLSLALLLPLCLMGGAESAKIEVVYWYSLGGAIADAIVEMVDNFNASQDKIFVNAQYQGEYDDAIAKLKAAGMGQLPCDVVQSYEIGSRFIIDSGWMVPMQEYIDRDGWDTSVIEPNLLAYYTVDGTIHAMPYNCSTPLLYYNKTAFDEAGITAPPATMDELFEIAPLLTTFNDDGSVQRYGYTISNYGWFVEQWVGKMGKHYVNNGNGRDSYPTEVVFGENGAMLDIFNVWAKIAADENTTYIERLGTAQARAAFVSDTSAIMIASTANLAGVLANVDGAFEVGTAFLPSINADDVGGVSTGGGCLWMVNSGDQEKMDATWEFIKYTVQPDTQAAWSAATGYFPINMEAHNTDLFKQNIDKFPQFQIALDQLHASGPQYVGSMLSVFPEVRQYVEDATEAVVQGTLMPEEAVAQLVSQANDAIEMYNLTNY